MSIAVAALNITLGLVYLQYGTMTLVDMKRNWSTMGFSHFGAAWVAMAFTCGPHHVEHGLHIAAAGRSGAPLDLIAVIIGFPAGVAWFLLRVEAFRGGQGDRFVAGSPLWVLALPTLAGIYVTAVVAAALEFSGYGVERLGLALPNLLLIGLYSAIGFYLIRTQLANRRPLGGWSISGLALAVIFPTCAVMHGVFALYVLTGTYDADPHGLAIDWLSVPAAAYFVYVVHALYSGKFRDWNRGPVATRTPSAESSSAAAAASGS
jgi:hypothetical protein